MNKVARKILLSILVFLSVLYLFDVIEMPTDPIYFIGVLLVLSVGILLHENVLTFLTIKKALPTRFLTIFGIVMGLIILFEIFVPGFYVNDFTIDAIPGDIITIEAYTFNKYVTIALLSAFVALVYSVMNKLCTPSAV